MVPKLRTRHEPEVGNTEVPPGTVLLALLVDAPDLRHLPGEFISYKALDRVGRAIKSVFDV